MPTKPINRFAFIIHPIEASDVSRKLTFTRGWSEEWIERLTRHLPPIKTSYITGVQSDHGEVDGFFISCPLTSRQMVNLPEEVVLQKILAACRKAERLGAQVVGLGAMTSVVGDAGATIARQLNIPVTTGNSYTVAMALEGVREGARIMGIDWPRAKVAVLGATGAIGKVCAQILAKEVGGLTLIARNQDRLRQLAARILYDTGMAAKITADVKAIGECDAVIAVSSAVDALIEPQDLKAGAVVLDVARPRDVSKLVAEQRPDVLVLEGGLVEVPGDCDFRFNFGFPPGLAYACMAETMILALEGRWESYTLGRDLTVRQVEEMARLGKKHGFRLAGFRGQKGPMMPEQVRSLAASILGQGLLYPTKIG